MGVKYDTARFFIKSFEESGVLDRVAIFLSLADSPIDSQIVYPEICPYMR